MEQIVPTFVEARAGLAAEINGLYIPFEAIPNALRRYAAPGLIFHPEESVYEMSKLGSSLFLRYRGRNFAVMTKHQLGEGADAQKPNNFIMVVRNEAGAAVGIVPQVATTPAFKDPSLENLGDLQIMEYIPPPARGGMANHFLRADLSKTLSSIPPEQVKMCFTIGFPTSAVKMDIECDDDGSPLHIKQDIPWVKLYLRPDAAQLLDTENRIPFIFENDAKQKEIEPDGMSGAPVFFVWVDEQSNANVGIAGIVSHANGRRYMVYGADDIRRVLDGYIAAGV